MVQPTSRVLKQEVVFDNSNVTSPDWVSNPVLRFADVVPVVVQRLEEPSRGWGGGDGRDSGGDRQRLLRRESHNAFAAESFLDEIAKDRGLDLIAFRLTLSESQPRMQTSRGRRNVRLEAAARRPR
jgi:CO/xanthine dehydrogenase Mo-binding subunit